MTPITAEDYADHLVKDEKEEAVIQQIEKYRCYECGQLYEGKPVKVLTDYHGEETSFCGECWEEYKTTIFANKFGF